MKIAIYTLTRDRLEYTKHCFNSLRAKAGYPFDHFVIDNGSKDGTQEWLKKVQEETPYAFKEVVYFSDNAGISGGSNKALDLIFAEGDYDLIIKMDNDCEVLSENILGQVVEIYNEIRTEQFECKYILSPYVEGIINQPVRGRYTMKADRRIGLTSIIGGIFHIVPAEVYKEYRYPAELPKAWGQDDHFCNWVKSNGAQVGYIEGLKVNHYETTNGQAKRFPEYFERKWKEEKK